MSEQATSSSTTSSRPVAAVILAAGKGTRISGDDPKVARRVAGRSMIEWVVDAVRAVDAQPIVLVVGYRQQVIRELFIEADDVVFAVQEKQLGTADAVNAARPQLAGFEGDVLVLAGDGPLIRESTLRELLEQHQSASAAATLATSIIDDPAGYGRIVRDGGGGFQAIVEHKNATADQLAIREINPSYYCFDAAALWEALDRVERNEVSGEYYVTDVPAILKGDGCRIEVIDAVPPEDVLSINTDEQLQEVDRILASRAEAPQ